MEKEAWNCCFLAPKCQAERCSTFCMSPVGKVGVRAQGSGFSHLLFPVNLLCGLKPAQEDASALSLEPQHEVNHRTGWLIFSHDTSIPQVTFSWISQLRLQRSKPPLVMLPQTLPSLAARAQGHHSPNPGHSRDGSDTQRHPSSFSKSSGVQADAQNSLCTA